MLIKVGWRGKKKSRVLKFLYLYLIARRAPSSCSAWQLPPLIIRLNLSEGNDNTQWEGEGKKSATKRPLLKFLLPALSGALSSRGGWAVKTDEPAPKKKKFWWGFDVTPGPLGLWTPEEKHRPPECLLQRPITHQNRTSASGEMP